MQAAPWLVLNKIAAACRAALGRKLTGIYVHGSIAFGCFNWDKSDIDLIVVTEEEPGQAEKEGLLARLLGLEADCPPKGVEMSVVLRKYCRPFHYPTPFELHYSAAHREKYQMDPASYCREMHGTDRDLAAHFTVIRAVGVTLCGTDKAAVFGEVPGEQYLDSIRRDVLEAAGAIETAPVYAVLNLCRVLAYTRDGLVLSKEAGAGWGLKNLPGRFRPLVEQARACYAGGGGFAADAGCLHGFAAYMLARIAGGSA